MLTLRWSDCDSCLSIVSRSHLLCQGAGKVDGWLSDLLGIGVLVRVRVRDPTVTMEVSRCPRHQRGHAADIVFGLPGPCALMVRAAKSRSTRASSSPSAITRSSRPPAS